MSNPDPPFSGLPEDECTQSEADEERALCDALACEVMGWHQAQVIWADGQSRDYWYAADNEPQVARLAWSPHRDARHYLQLVDRLLSAGLEHRHKFDGKIYRSELWFESDAVAAETANDVKLALCLAARRACELLKINSMWPR